MTMLARQAVQEELLRKKQLGLPIARLLGSEVVIELNGVVVERLPLLYGERYSERNFSGDVWP